MLQTCPVEPLHPSLRCAFNLDQKNPKPSKHPRTSLTPDEISNSLVLRAAVWHQHKNRAQCAATPCTFYILLINPVTSVSCLKAGTHSLFSWAISKEAAMFMRVGRQCRWWLWLWGRMVLAWGGKKIKLKKKRIKGKTRKTERKCRSSGCMFKSYQVKWIEHGVTIWRSSPSRMVARTDMLSSLLVITSTRPCGGQIQDIKQVGQRHHRKKKNSMVNGFTSNSPLLMKADSTRAR